MVILDTNVLSEVLKPVPDAGVLGWLARQDRAEVFTTAITQAEILYGLELLPAGKRQLQLRAAVGQMFTTEFQDRILPFGMEAAAIFPLVVADRTRAGRPISQFDGLIAAICRAHGLALATRNVRDFEGCGLEIVNPWK